MSKKPDVTQSDGNIFAYLGIDTVVELTRFELSSFQMPLKEAAEWFGLELSNDRGRVFEPWRWSAAVMQAHRSKTKENSVQFGG